ncbi:mannosyltransferase putative-domain-containing protein [Mrakia frigida]|uniref:mannosyltransferase putative-domain-containing protein n=1 Tax=Mrakia frigida TaxID=29902 RepID=UPI003FCC0552
MLLRKGNALILLVTISLTVLVFLTFFSSSSTSSSSPHSSSHLFDSPTWDLSSDESLSGGVHILPIDMGHPNDLGDQGEVTFTNDDDELKLNSPPPSSPQDSDSSPMSGSPDPRPLLSFPTHPPLRTRLEAFLRRPTLSYEQALEHNVKLCPLEIHDRQVNPDQLKGEREGWKTLTVEEIGRRRRSLVNGLSKVEEGGKQVVAGMEIEGGGAGAGGRGIVVAGGNQDTTARILTLLRILRSTRLNSTLPVQVFHFKGEITAENERDEIRLLGGELFEFEGEEKEAGVWKNFQIKALAILQSTFSEVLYLDSDNLPLQDPAVLFDSPLYTDGGRAVFWPDLNKDHPENAIFRVLGEECRHEEWQIDSGQMLIDKRGNQGLNLAALHIAAIMQQDYRFWFSLSGGDKDTFRYAFHILDIPFAASPTWLSSMGSLNPFENNRFCGHSMLQYSLPTLPPTPLKPLFIHANLLKHTASLPRGSVFSHIKSIRPSIKTTPEGKREGLDGARGWVYQGPGRGMCVDLEWVGGEEGESGKDGVETKEWEGAKEFEDLFWEMGGKVGGW